MSRLKMYFLFGGLGLLAFLFATNGFEILASVMLADKTIADAVHESLRYTILQPLGALFLSFPFFAISILAAELANGLSLLKGYLFFLTGFVCVGYLYFMGYWNAQHALLEGKWTASTLSIGLLPLKSLPIIVLAALVVGFMFWKSVRKSEKQD